MIDLSTLFNYAEILYTYYYLSLLLLCGLILLIAILAVIVLNHFDSNEIKTQTIQYFSDSQQQMLDVAELIASLPF